MADVATLGGVPIPSGPASVRVSCAPTYAMSHRWSWPNADGVTACACGIDTSGAWDQDKIACEIYARSLRPDSDFGDMGQFWYNDLSDPGRYGAAVEWVSATPIASPLAYDRQRCERLRGTHWTPLAGHDVPSLDNLPAECCSGFEYTAEQQDFLDSSDAIDLRWSRELGEWRWVKRDDSGRGLEWIWPDAQMIAPTLNNTPEYLSPEQVQTIVERFACITGIQGLWSELRQDWFYSEIEAAQVRREQVAEAERQAHGGIVRLGHELREADGVTPRAGQ